MQRVAEIFLELQHAGNVEHSRSVVVFHRCAAYKDEVFNEIAAKALVSVLQNQANDMERSLSEWKTQVKEARVKYYHLNSYTLMQLLTLRKELGCFKTWDSSVVPRMTLLLLGSVSSNLDGSYVKKAVLQATTPNLLTESTGPQERIKDKISTMPESKVYDSKTKPSLSEQNTLDKTRAHWPKIRENDLSKEQKQILTNLVDYQKFSKLFVLRGFEECGPESNKYDIEKWCDDNVAIYHPDSDSGSGFNSDTDTDNDNDSSDSDSKSNCDSSSVVDVQHTENISSSVSKDFSGDSG